MYIHTCARSCWLTRRDAFRVEYVDRVYRYRYNYIYVRRRYSCRGDDDDDDVPIALSLARMHRRSIFLAAQVCTVYTGIYTHKASVTGGNTLIIYREL